MGPRSARAEGSPGGDDDGACNLVRFCSLPCMGKLFLIMMLLGIAVLIGLAAFIIMM